MKKLLTIPLDDFETKMLQLADENNGHVKLDFSNDFHYNYLLKRLGGETQLKAKAPDLLKLLQKEQMHCKLRQAETGSEQVESEIILEDLEFISNIEVSEKIFPKTGSSDRNASCLRLSAKSEASYATMQVSDLTLMSRVCDCKTNHIIDEDTFHLSPDEHHRFCCTMETDIPVPNPQNERVHQYRVTSLFIAVSPQVDGGMRLTSGYVASPYACISAKSDIKRIEVLDPVIKNASIREEHKNEICVAYKRKDCLKNPDYEYGVDLEHLIKEMPVHLDFKFTIELQNGAYFQPDSRGSYFDEKYDPQISLSRFDNIKCEPISAGHAPLFQDWIDFSGKHIDVLKTDEAKNATALLLTFPTIWDANLKKDDFFNIATYADFYAKVSFNTMNPDANGKKYQTTTSAFFCYQTNENARANPTKPATNNAHIPRLFFQWGCLSAHTQLHSTHGLIRACDVKLGDLLLNRSQKYVPVKNIITGTEPTILHIRHEKGDIFLTPDHTLCTASGEPIPAKSLKCGDSVLAWNSELKKEEPTAITAITTEPYERDVYNFYFDEPTLLIAEGLIVGDHAYQQMIRPYAEPLKPVLRNRAVSRLMAQLKTMTAPVSTIPPAVFSDKPECLPLHYFAVKALARYQDLYTEEQAQLIAEYCQFLSDNASTGGIRVESIPQELNHADICTPYNDDTGLGYIVPMTPCAMANWYDKEELKQKKSWLILPDTDCKNRTYNVYDDILAPFHYPITYPSSNLKDTDCVKYHSTVIKKQLFHVTWRAQKKMNHRTLMAMGIAIHLLADSMMHQRFSPRQNWRNLGRVQEVFSPDGHEITDEPAFRPYCNYPFEEYKKSAEYPSGIQQLGKAAETPSAKFDYLYPLSSGELPLDPDGGNIQYEGYRMTMNFSNFSRVCEQILRFLCDCKNKTFDEASWNQILSKCLTNLFKNENTTFDRLKTIWNTEFSTTNFTYDANVVFQRLVGGDTQKETELEQYQELFDYTLLLYRLKKGEDLLG